MNQSAIVDPELLDMNLEYVEKTSLALKRAVDELHVHRAAQEKAAALRPAILELGKRVGCFPAHQIKEAEAMLASPETTMYLLKQAFELIEKKNATAKTELGDAADAQTTKAAGDNGIVPDGGYDSTKDPVVGNKSPMGKKASDIAFERILQQPS